MTPTLNSDTWMVFDIMYYQCEAKNDCPSTETSILLAPVLPFRVSEFLHGRIETTRIVRRLTRSNARNKTAGGGNALPASDRILDVATPDARHPRPLKFLFTALRLTIATTRPLWRAQQDPGRQ
jgi:hypothetical protein